MACVATWSFGLQAVEIVATEVQNGASCIDALEKSINAVEDDPQTGKYFVGRGCYPNLDGVVQLDAAIMTGKGCQFGAVAGMKGYSKPISVARSVMESCNANFLVGDGASSFACEQGFVMEDNETLLTAETKKAYVDFKATGRLPHVTGHDTLSVLCLDKFGEVVAGVSTSGPPFKAPGRVGDSPMPGCGLYCNGKAGAAAATGAGEKIMTFCPSHHVVQLLQQGAQPRAACEVVVREMLESSADWFEVGLIALDMKGNIGAATSVKEWKDFRDGRTYSGFPCASWQAGAEPTIITYPSCY